MRKTRVILAFILAAALLAPMLPSLPVSASTGRAIDVTVHYFRADGDYRDTDVWVGNFGAAPAPLARTWAAEGAWRKATFTVTGVEENEYIAFQMMRDSVFTNDLRYIDPWGGDFNSNPGTGTNGIEIWLIDGDARAYAAPILVPAEKVMERFGVRYIDIENLAELISGTGVNNFNELTITRPMNGFNFDGALANTVTLIQIIRGGFRHGNIQNAGSDRFEINPLTNRIIYNRSGNMAAGPMTGATWDYTGVRAAEA